MERAMRLLGLWANLVWAIIAVAFWVFNAVTVVASDTPPSTDGLVFLAAMAFVGMSVGLAVHTVLALLRVGYYSGKVTPKPSPDELIGGLIVGSVGLGWATAHSLGGASGRWSGSQSASWRLRVASHWCRRRSASSPVIAK